MDAQFLDSLFNQEGNEEYFYACFQGQKMIYGGYYVDGSLRDILITMFDNCPESRPDLIEAASYILASTDN